MKSSRQISFVMPIYGQFDLARAVLSVKSALTQKGVDLEVVISEQGETPRFPKIDGIKHVFSYHKPQADLSDFNPGDIRNIAILHTTGEFVYTNDADVLFIDTYYLANAINILMGNPRKVFYRPKMRRLPTDNFEEFKRRVKSRGIEVAIAGLDFSQEYIVTTDGKPRHVEIFKKNSVYPKTFTAFGEDFDRYVSDESLRGREPLIWNENRHCGGNLFRRAQFDEVGGYSEEFINWGCEDSDLQWKFNEIYDLQFFPNRFKVIHLDHPKEYFSPEMWKRNEEISARRVKEGISKAIKKDRIIYLRGTK